MAHCSSFNYCLKNKLINVKRADWWQTPTEKQKADRMTLAFFCWLNTFLSRKVFFLQD